MITERAGRTLPHSCVPGSVDAANAANAAVRSWRQVLLVTVSVFVAGVLAGCAGEPPRDTTCKLSGLVTFDGKPLAQGQVLFSDVGPEQRQHVGDIREGRYQASTTPGEKKVLIRAFVEAKPPPGGGRPDLVQLIPARYNEETTLRVTVQPGENREANFDLTSNP